ncbi:MAG: sigma-70 family RNA polymerase sigma factor [Ardenticatenaceae bacterium]|nr:sigma-70 family RNA polymerase sigma factor [Ardenticatenaceae bacterium]
MMLMQLINPLEPVNVVEDDMLVARAQQNLGAFSELYQRHVQRVYRYVLVRVGGNVQDAQDLTSQTFLAAMEGLKSYRSTQPFVAWLLGIARHKVADQFRRQKPQVDLETAVSLTDTNTDDPDEQLDQQLDIARVTRKLQTIAPDRAEVITLRLMAGLEVPDIARLLDKNEAAVRMLLFRGLRDLQTQLNVTQESKA